MVYDKINRYLFEVLYMKRKILFLSLFALLLVGCQDVSSSLPSENSSTSKPNGSSTTTSTTAPVDIKEFLDKLTPSDGLAFTGTLTLTTTETNVSNVHGFLSDDEYYLYEDGYTPSHYYLGTGQYDGYIVGRELLPNNTLEEFPYVNDLNQYIKFSDYLNPITKLQASNFKAEDNLFVATIPNTLQETFGYVFLGYNNLPIQEFSFMYNSEHEITSLTFNGTGEGVEVEFVFNLATKEEVKVPVVEVRKHEPEHDALQEAFDKLAEGNYTVSYTDVDPTGEYSTEKYLVKSDDNAIYIQNQNASTKKPYGYLQLDEGLVSVEYDDETHIAKGNANPDSTRKLTDFKSKFDIAPELFTIKDENTFTITEGVGMENYLDMFWADKVLEGSNFELSDPTSYSFTISSNETYIVKYSYDILGYEGDVTLVISDIGTTDTGYDKTNYEEKDAEQNNWSDLNVEGLESYLTEKVGSPDNLPYPNNIEGLSVASDDIMFDYNIFNVNFDSSVFTNNAAAIAAYEQALKGLGWVKTGESEYGDIYYTLTTRTGLYKISLYGMSSMSYFQITFYDPEPVSTSNPLSEFIQDNFSESINSTLESTIKINIYQASEEDYVSNTYGNLLSSQTTRKSALFTDTAIYSETQGAEEAITYASENDGTVTFYSKTSDGWKQDDVKMGTLTSLYYTLNDLALTAPYIIANDDGTYTITDASSISTFTAFFFGISFNNYDSASVVLTFDEETKTITFDFDMEDYFVDEEGTYSYRVYDCSGTISDIGTTTITDIPTI